MGAAPCFGWLGEARHTLTSEALEASPARSSARRRLKLREIWAIRIRLSSPISCATSPLQPRHRQKARGCDRVDRRVRDVAHGGTVAHRAIVLQHETPAAGVVRADRPDPGVGRRLDRPRKAPTRGVPVPEPVRQSPHLTTRQHAGWSKAGSMNTNTQPQTMQVTQAPSSQRICAV